MVGDHGVLGLSDKLQRKQNALEGCRFNKAV